MDSQKSLTIALLITLVIFFVEVVGSILSNSLALFSDAGHMLTDVMALGLALFASVFAKQQAEGERTYGFYRLEILSAFLNGTLLTLISLYIFYQAYQRFLHPAPVESGLMLVVATVGLLANIGSALALSGGHKENLNVKGALLHVLSDLGASVGVIIGGVIIYFTKWYYVDPILGVLIAVLILRGAIDLALDSMNILLEAAPKGVRSEEVAETIKKVKGVREIHDLHIWAITSGMNAISAHLVIDDSESGRVSEILREAGEILKTKYNFLHSTFQTECESCPEGLICRMEPEHGSH